MAKQMYIDENGNPIQVSGTVNTAELLPISGNDTTDTKTYIDGFVNGVHCKTFDIEVVFSNNYYSTGNNIENETGIPLNKIVGVLAYSYNTIPLVCNVSNTGILYTQRFDKSVVTETKTFTFIVWYKD